jgi:hypothetical protein
MDFIQQIKENKTDMLPYLGMCYNIIQRNWNNEYIIFKNVNSGTKRKIIYSLAEACSLKFKVTKIDYKEFINWKLVRNPPPGYDIEYHSLTCQDCPEITHPELGKCGKIEGPYDTRGNCKYCNKVPDLTVLETMKDIKLTHTRRSKLINLELNVPNFQEPNHEIGQRCEFKPLKQNVQNSNKNV